MYFSESFRLHFFFRTMRHSVFRPISRDLSTQTYRSFWREFERELSYEMYFCVQQNSSMLVVDFTSWGHKETLIKRIVDLYFLQLNTSPKRLLYMAGFRCYCTKEIRKIHGNTDEQQRKTHKTKQAQNYETLQKTKLRNPVAGAVLTQVEIL